jgi:flagellar basal-body rod modification protein FlgD
MGNMVLATSSTNSTLAVDFIGKNIKMTGDSFYLGTDRQADVNFHADDDAVATVKIKGDDGSIVRTFEVPAKKGQNSMSWDGLDDEGQPVDEGKYTVEISAKTSEGVDVATQTEAIQRVKAVSFTNGYPELILENGEKVSLSEVSEVVGDKSNPQEEE